MKLKGITMLRKLLLIGLLLLMNLGFSFAKNQEFGGLQATADCGYLPNEFEYIPDLNVPSKICDFGADTTQDEYAIAYCFNKNDKFRKAYKKRASLDDRLNGACYRPGGKVRFTLNTHFPSTEPVLQHKLQCDNPQKVDRYFCYIYDPDYRKIVLKAYGKGLSRSDMLKRVKGYSELEKRSCMYTTLNSDSYINFIACADVFIIANSI